MPGRTSLAPVRGAQNVRPQALAWNIGTMARMTERADRQHASTLATVSACRMLARCEYSTPCGNTMKS